MTTDFDTTQRHELLTLARESIESSLRAGRFVECPYRAFSPLFMARRSSFVTLRVNGELRGCCGTIDAPRPLAQDVWRNAWASAFDDPRFPQLPADEWRRCDLHISVLSEPQPLIVSNEHELLVRLQPFVDGLILELGPASVTFLPAVWEQIGNPHHFVRQLKLKAGWPADFWSPQIRVYRYVTESFGGDPEFE